MWLITRALARGPPISSTVVEPVGVEQVLAFTQVAAVGVQVGLAEEARPIAEVA